MESGQDGVFLSKAGQKNGPRLTQNLEKTRESRRWEKSRNRFPFPEAVEMEGELKDRVAHDLELASLVMQDIGYSESEAKNRLPVIDQIHFYRIYSNRDNTSGEFFHEGGRINIQFDCNNVSIDDWQRIGPTLVHEIGHYPAKRIYGPAVDDENQASLVSIGFDRKKRFVTVLGEQEYQGGDNDKYMQGILTEPLADLFGYYCTEKRQDKTDFHVWSYYRETSFTIALLQKLADIRHTQFFAEFSRMYKSFNEADVSYFVTLRDDFAKYWQEQGLAQDEAQKKATEFVSSLNRIQSKQGKDSVADKLEGDLNTIQFVSYKEGSQLSQLAKDGGFFDQYEANAGAIDGPGLVLENSATVMTGDVYRQSKLHQ